MENGDRHQTYPGGWKGYFNELDARFAVGAHEEEGGCG